MSSKDPRLPLRHILTSIELIEQFTAGRSVDEFQADPMRVAAVERHLQKISEAAIRLGEQAEMLCPGMPWREIRGIGNWLRHQYERVDLAIIWSVAVDDLPALKRSVARALDHLKPPGAEPG